MLGLISALIAATSPIMPPSAVPGAPGASASQRSARSAVPTQDGFALSVANRYAADIGAQDRAAGNVRAGAALLQVADRGLQDIDALLAKMKALACYAGEMRPFPHPRSVEAIEALARWRGASAGLQAAEAFHVIRQVVTG